MPSYIEICLAAAVVDSAATRYSQRTVRNGLPSDRSLAAAVPLGARAVHTSLSPLFGSLDGVLLLVIGLRSFAARGQPKEETRLRNQWFSIRIPRATLYLDLLSILLWYIVFTPTEALDEQLPEETVAFFRDTETTLEVLDTVRPTPRQTESPRRSHPATSGRSDPVVDLPAPSARVRRSRATLTRAVPRTTRSLPSQPNAIATYNILVQEGRQVAAAMILPSS